MTEAELVAVDNCMGQILWTYYFLKAQGNQVDDSILYIKTIAAPCCWNRMDVAPAAREHNTSISVYFFVTDWIHKNDLMVTHLSN